MDYIAKRKELYEQIEICEKRQKRSSDWLLLLIGFWLFLYGVSKLSGLIIALGVVCVIVGIRLAKGSLESGRRLNELKDELKEIEPLVMKQIQLERYSKEGAWKFPSGSFYEECVAAGITEENMDTSFYVQKELAIARALAQRDGVPDECFDIQFSKEKIHTYYHEGYFVAKEKEEQEAKRRLREEAERKIRESTPQRGRPNREEAALIKFNQKLFDASEIQKRELLLREEKMQPLTEEIEEAKESTETFSNFMKAKGNSLSADNTRDLILIKSTLEYSQKASNKLESLERRMQSLEKEIAELRGKTVLDVGKDELLKNLKINSIKCEKTGNNILDVTVNCTNKFVPDVPEGVKIVVDGVLVVEIKDQNVVGSALVPLPLYGVACGGSATMRGLCPYYMEGEHNYTAEVKDCKLWAMER